MQIGQGYIIRQMETGDFTFTGIPNGSIPITIGVTDSFNLIGNPYPSALDADKFYRKNRGARGTIYFWTHSTAITLRADLLQEPQVLEI
jgi:hypothetical protein